MSHPADQIISRLASIPPPKATPGERSTIVARMSSAPFSSERHTAEKWAEIGTNIIGEPHPAGTGPIQPTTVLTSLEAHIAKRIKDDLWAPGTSPADYLSDLHAAAGHAEAHLYVGQNERSHPAGATTTRLSARGLPTLRIKAKVSDCVFVVYDAAKSAVVTGYIVPEVVAFQRMKKWARSRLINR